MPKTKSTKPATVKIAKVESRAIAKKEPPIKDGVIDTAYQNILDKVVAAYRTAQASSLIWHWELGQLFVEFEETVVGKLAGRTTEVFLKDLAERDIPEMGESTLYLGKRIFLKYKRDSLAQMAKAGFGTGVVKKLFGLEKEPEILAKVSAALAKPDGTVMTNNEVDDLIAKLRQTAKVEGHIKAVTDTAKAASSTPSPREASQERTVGNVMQDVSENGTASDDESTVPPAGVPDNADGKSGSRGASPVATYTCSPQKALKATDSAATKLMASLSDTIIAATEITKVGFDHPPTKDKVRELLASCRAGVTDLIRALPDVEKRLQEALDDVSA